MENKKQIIMDAFNFRYACKKYDESKVISEENFNIILEAARLSPSSFGLELCKFLVVQNVELKEKLRPVAWGAQNSFNGASHFVIILARKKIDTIYNSDYVNHIINDIKKLPSDIAEKMKKAFESFQKNDFNLLESDRAIFDWASKQTYIALANMLTAAALMGIDSCAIEGFNREAVENLLKNEGILETEHFGVSVMASFGYRAETPFPKTRQDINSVVQWS